MLEVVEEEYKDDDDDKLLEADCVEGICVAAADRGGTYRGAGISLCGGDESNGSIILFVFSDISKLYLCLFGSLRL